MEKIPTKTELIAEIHREWGLLEAVLNGLSEAQMTAPATLGLWSVKDMLAHISYWEKFLLDRLGSAISGEAGQYPPIHSDAEVDRLNARVFAENQERPLSAVLLEFRTLYTAVLTAVEALDEAAIARPLPLDFPLDNLIAWQIIRANTSDHYQEHRLALEDWLKGQGVI
jgi:hypothetical protein